MLKNLLKNLNQIVFQDGFLPNGHYLSFDIYQHLDAAYDYLITNYNDFPDLALAVEEAMNSIRDEEEERASWDHPEWHNYDEGLHTESFWEDMKSRNWLRTYYDRSNNTLYIEGEAESIKNSYDRVMRLKKAIEDEIIDEIDIKWTKT